jgi:hypothetical protein
MPCPQHHGPGLCSARGRRSTPAADSTPVTNSYPPRRTGPPGGYPHRHHPPPTGGSPEDIRTTIVNTRLRARIHRGLTQRGHGGGSTGPRTPKQPWLAPCHHGHATPPWSPSCVTWRATARQGGGGRRRRRSGRRRGGRGLLNSPVPGRNGCGRVPPRPPHPPPPQTGPS